MQAEPSCAQVLGYSVEAKLAPLVAWFLSLGFSTVDVASVLLRFPNLTGTSVSRNLEPTVCWMHSKGESCRSPFGACGERSPA